MNFAAENLRYLLWKQGVRREDWIIQLAAWAQCTAGRANDLLQGATLSSEEQRKIALHLRVGEEEIQTERFVGDQVNVLRQNLLFLTDKSVTGFTASEVAQAIEVSPVTISRWRKGKQVPEETQLAKLCQFLGFPAKLNLKQEAVFLWLSPIGDLQRRVWLQQRLAKLEPEALHALFPALEKLLK